MYRWLLRYFIEEYYIHQHPDVEVFRISVGKNTSLLYDIYFKSKLRCPAFVKYAISAQKYQVFVHCINIEKIL